MPESSPQSAAIRSHRRSAARAASVLPVAGAFFVAITLALPHPPGGNTTALIGISAGMFLAGLLCWFGADAIPPKGTHLLLATTVAMTGLLIYESGIATGQYGTIFVWSALICGYFFPRRVAWAHLAWILLVYGVTLAVVPSTAGYSPVTRWLITLVSLSVVMTLAGEISVRRARADQRARRFFDLSQDMLCTMDTSGRCVEAGEAWRRSLGYEHGELEGRRLIELTHPDDREDAIAAAVELFENGSAGEIETRIRASDDSWHWLRTSYAISSDEGLVYARSTDVTELKNVEAEREELLGQVQLLAREDPLTGLPNRLVLDEIVPREMSSARRRSASLCLAILDIDHFKAYNDTHGHLAGDAMLRACARAWDPQLRGGDTVARFGGEEFVVVLPDTGIGSAVQIVDRLRAATPNEQTCSAGLAHWDYSEPIDSLIERADQALYAAKNGGRDRTVAASTVPPDRR